MNQRQHILRFGPMLKRFPIDRSRISYFQDICPFQTAEDIL